ncbi:MAG TPA: DoxX family protein [Candidatus Paceibacterota bacterium]|nr:DoxX family protein [Candidatus Paceibacterota bacterium]
MTPKAKRITYWVVTALFCLWLLGDGVAGIVHTSAGVAIFVQLTMPLYVMTIVGTAKVLAAFAIIQTRWRTIKEWAFAGYAIDCVGAAACHYFAASPAWEIALSFFFLAVTFAVYAMWKKGWGN